MKKFRLLFFAVVILRIDGFQVNAASDATSESEFVKPLDDETFKKLLNDIENANCETVEGLSLLAQFAEGTYLKKATMLEQERRRIEQQNKVVVSFSGQIERFNKKMKQMNAYGPRWMKLEEKAMNKVALVMNDYNSLRNNFHTKAKAEDLPWYAVLAFYEIRDDAKKLLQKLSLFLQIDTEIFKSTKDQWLSCKDDYKNIYDVTSQKCMQGIIYGVSGLVVICLVGCALYAYVTKKKRVVRKLS